MEKGVISYNEIVALEYEEGLHNYNGDEGTVTLLKKLGASFEEVFVLRISKRLMIFASTTSLHELEQVLYQEGIHHQANLCFFNTHSSAKHLFEVASGVQPVLFWESDIAGQIEKHWQLAEKEDTIGPLFSNLIKASIQCGTRVRERKIDINPSSCFMSGGLSLIHNGLEYFTMQYLLGGVGTVEKELPEILKDKKVNKLYIASHQFARAEEIAKSYGASTVEIHDLKSKYPDLEVVFFCRGVEKWFDNFYKKHSSEDKGEGCDHSILIDYSIIGDIPKIEAFIENPWTTNAQITIDYNLLLDLLENFCKEFGQPKTDLI